MSTVKLIFNTLDEANFQMYFYELPLLIQEEIIKSLELEGSNEFVLAFSSFLNYDNVHHREILDHVFNNVPKNLTEYKVPYGVSFHFTERDEYLELLTLDDLTFICAVLHNLNLKKYLLPICKLTMNTSNLTFEEIKERSKSDTFKMAIFAK